MKIEAVSICVNFSDYFSYCVKNKKHFNRWVVVTIAEDYDTIDLCKQHDIECVLSKDLYTDRDGGPAVFAKGRAINEGLSILDRDDWLVHLDSDIILPDNTRKVIKKSDLKEHILYGLEGRYMAHSRKDLRREPSKLPFGKKTHDKNERQEKPFTGWFQMWHSSIRVDYRAKSRNARKDDISFRRKWKKENRKILNLRAIHLGSRKDNWEGRVAPPFV